MQNSLKIRPFGILFEEPVTADITIIEPIYDEDEDLNVLVLEDGTKVPYVEFCNSIGTKTETFQNREGSDEDPGTETAGTKTITGATKERPDSDDLLFQSLGTKTGTAVKREQPDDDPSNEYSYHFVMGTKTATKTSGEQSDDDDEVKP